MKIIKVRDGKIKIDGVYYSDKHVESPIMGKSGRIQSINIDGKQYFPYAGHFEDTSIPTTSDNTGIVEETKSVKKGRKSK
jgi:hypothetical protein